MSAPYSDNLYSSMADSDNDENQHQNSQDYTAPTDGYFHASASLSDEPLAGPSTTGPSHGVPYVPNVMVADPSLRPGSTIEDKAIGLGRDVLNLDARATSPSSGQSSQLHGNPPPVAEGRPEVEMGRSLPVSSHNQSSSSSSLSSSSTQQEFGQSESPRQEERSRNLTTTTYIPPQSSSPTMGRPEDNHYSHRHHHHSSPLPTHSPRRDPFVERTPNIPSEAPPAYSPRSPTSQSTGYSTFTPPTPYTPVEAMGRPEEVEPLLGRPQSMGPPLGGGEAAMLAWRNRRKSKGLFGNLCLGLLTFTAILFALAASFHLAFGDPAKQDPPPSLPPNEPVKPPPTSPKHPDDNQEIPNDDQGPITFPHSYCRSDTIRHMPEQTWPLTFSPSHNITIGQNVYKTNGPRYRLGVYGAIVVRPLPHSSSSEGELRLNIATNLDFPADQIHVSYDPSIQRLFIDFPRLVDWAPDTNDGWPCALVYATIWVPSSGVELDTIGLESVHLDICTLHDLELNAKTAIMDTVIGWVTGGITETVPTSGSLGKQPPSMPAEYRFVADTVAAKTVSGGIQGNWYLKDMLSFETASGDVVVGVTPLEGKGPATLNVKTISGEQTVIEDGVGQRGRTVPARDYIVGFGSTSGGMEARVAFGSGASFSSISGDMELALLPVVDAARQEKENEPWMGLGTQSTSGDVMVEVLEPQWFGTKALRKEEEERDVHWGDAGDGDPYRGMFPPDNEGKDDAAARVGGGGQVLKALASMHQATSGDINVKYPNAWEGMVTIDTLAADVALRGDELRIIEAHKGPGFGRKVVARKGEVDGTSRAKIKTLSGDIRFEVV